MNSLAQLKAKISQATQGRIWPWIWRILQGLAGVGLLEGSLRLAGESLQKLGSRLLENLGLLMLFLPCLVSGVFAGLWLSSRRKLKELNDTLSTPPQALEGKTRDVFGFVAKGVPGKYVSHIASGLGLDIEKVRLELDQLTAWKLVACEPHYDSHSETFSLTPKGRKYADTMGLFDQNPDSLPPPPEGGEWK